MNRKLGIVLSLFTLVGGSSLAFADGGPQAAEAGCAEKHSGMREKRLERFDLNHDGKLDDAERAKMREAFAEKRADVVDRYDLNHDGTLDANERLQMRKDFVAKMFARIDANGDGQISVAEAQCTRLAKRFAQIDTDRSGSLSQDEVLAAGPMGGFGHHHAMRRVKRVIDNG